MARSYSHWSLRYAWDRIAALYYKLSHPGYPWLTRESIRRLQTILDHDSCGFEWGAGKSTIWFAKRVHQLTSVEHDAKWYGRVEQQLMFAGLHNVRLIHKVNEEEYVAVADSFTDESLDFALVDGLSELRAQCALAIIPKLRRGGTLVIDDIHRYLPSNSRAPLALGQDSSPSALWQQVCNQTAKWPLEWSSDGVKDTALWRKP